MFRFVVYYLPLIRSNSSHVLTRLNLIVFFLVLQIMSVLLKDVQYLLSVVVVRQRHDVSELVILLNQVQTREDCRVLLKEGREGGKEGGKEQVREGVREGVRE